jgi:hypothetical protein
MKDELERMWKEGVVAYAKVLSFPLPGGTVENDKRVLPGIVIIPFKI